MSNGDSIRDVIARKTYQTITQIILLTLTIIEHILTAMLNLKRACTNCSKKREIVAMRQLYVMMMGVVVVGY